MNMSARTDNMYNLKEKSSLENNFSPEKYLEIRYTTK